MEQVAQASEHWRGVGLRFVRWGVVCSGPVGPLDRDQRSTFIGEDNEQVWPTFSVGLP